MKHQFLKKLAVFALAVGMLLPVAAPAVQAKAEKKKEVWVLDTEACKYKNTSGDYEDSYKNRYQYNKNGLLTVVKGNQSSMKYVYKGTKISKRLNTALSDSGSYVLDETYTYNKNGRLTKSVRASDSNYVTKYTWKDGLCIKDALAYTGSENDYFYDKNGWIIKLDSNGIWTTEYDKHGYIVSESSESAAYLYKNKYKDGRLASHTELNNGNESIVTTYKYKKIKVPASRVKQVKRQQDWLTNKGNMQLLPLAAY